MTAPAIAPYGSWKSPITSDLIVAGTVGLGQLALDGADTYWTELRPAEGGRTVIVRRTPDGGLADCTPAPFDVRTRVHEYGGGAFLVDRGALYFSNFADQRLYRQAKGGTPQALTRAEDSRYADGCVDSARDRFVYVNEDHRTHGREPINTLVHVDRRTGDTRVLVSGSDFYSSPRLSPDGRRLAWLAWSHPNMPWDATELWVAGVATDGSLSRTERVAGGPDTSVCQPEWSPDGALHFVSDQTGWWNLYRWHGGGIESLCPMPADFGRPHWVFGMSTFGVISNQELLCTFTQCGTWRLAVLDIATRRLEPIELPYTEISGLRTTRGRAVFLAGSPAEPLSIVQLELATRELRVVHRSSDSPIGAGYLSAPRPMEFPTEHGLNAHAGYYPPQNQDYRGTAGERPPLLVKGHGGPTSAASTALNPGIQYWTSRGFAVVDVDYGGSSGYGRAYRQRLNGQWGVVDVADCVNAARFLVRQGKADRNRLAITGGSAGGYTTLCALTFHDTFSAGASHYGICDLEALARDTHKFESHYTDRLIGPYPEQRALYRARSPIHFTDRLSCPLIFFQGLEDRIVPPNQAEVMVSVLRAKGLPVAYVAFAGEQHGFRQARNIKRALDGELYFYSRIFGFVLAEPIDPVVIENLASTTL